MKILVINPNTTESMTALIGKQARAVVSPGVAVDAVNPSVGPAGLESHYDEAIATPRLLELISDGELQGYDGHVIACFGDPGLLAAREVASGPVVGMAEAAMRTASYLGRSFSVVTTVSRSIGQAYDLARVYGVREQCAGVHATEIAPDALLMDPQAATAVLNACRQALLLDGSDVLVLGCSGMAGMAAEISAELGVPVVEGVSAATLEVEKLVRLGLRTSTRGEFAPPRQRYPV